MNWDNYEPESDEQREVIEKFSDVIRDVRARNSDYYELRPYLQGPAPRVGLLGIVGQQRPFVRPDMTAASPPTLDPSLLINANSSTASNSSPRIDPPPVPERRELLKRGTRYAGPNFANWPICPRCDGAMPWIARFCPRCGFNQCKPPRKRQSASTWFTWASVGLLLGCVVVYFLLSL